ncbi:hypothetical protein LZ554_001290 [Drepanopeziza brunnea f. sp. 'monogermtubi']|nr:hypothetical protein LZ554_001290 [Drepanopeziza brunnea f. sp. 'monogermtubi']
MRRNKQQVVTRTTKPTLMTRLRGRNAKTRTTKTTTTVETVNARPVRTSHRTAGHHTHTTTTAVRQKRRVTLGDKISGAIMKIKGSLTRKPGLKAAGTRRMNGTDGRGSHRAY